MPQFLSLHLVSKTNDEIKERKKMKYTVQLFVTPKKQQQYMYALKRMHVSLKLLPIRDSLKGSEPSVRMKKKTFGILDRQQGALKKRKIQMSLAIHVCAEKNACFFEAFTH